MDEVSGMIAVVILSLFAGLMIGLGIADPNELDNGCIVHHNAIYCEVAE